MLVQWPPAQTGGIKFIALQNDCPFLPQDETGAGFILVTDRHFVLKEVGHKKWDSYLEEKKKNNYKMQKALLNFTRVSPSKLHPSH